MVMKFRLTYQYEVLLLCSSTWFFMFSAGLIGGIVLPFLRDAFSITLTQAGAVMTLLWFTNALIQFPAGLLADRLGEQRVIGFGLIFMVLAGVFTLRLRKPPTEEDVALVG